MSDKKIGVGVLGLHEGRTLLVACGRTRHARAVAGCDLRPEKIERAKRDLPDLFYTASFDEMLARSDVDVVGIFTPDTMHADHIVRCFRAGKHVICTKPLVNSIEGARRVFAAARETQRRLLVGQSTRFFEAFRRQRAAFERGEVGELEFVDAHYVHRMDWFYEKSAWATDETDWVFLGMSHPVDLVRWYLGEIREVHALAQRSALARRYGVRSNDIYSVQFLAADGRIARAYGNYGLHELPSARNAIELVLYGSEGTSLAQYHDMRYWHTAADGTEVKEDMLYARRTYYFNDEVHGMHYGEFANYTESFARGLLEDIAVSPELEEGLETVCVMEAIQRSASERVPVAVGPLLEEAGLRG